MDRNEQATRVTVLLGKELFCGSSHFSRIDGNEVARETRSGLNDHKVLSDTG